MLRLFVSPDLLAIVVAAICSTVPGPVIVIIQESALPPPPPAGRTLADVLLALTNLIPGSTEILYRPFRFTTLPSPRLASSAQATLSSGPSVLRRKISVLNHHRLLLSLPPEGHCRPDRTLFAHDLMEAPSRGTPALPFI